MDERDKAGSVKNIEVGGRKVPCRVTMGAMVRFRRETGCDISQIKKDDIEGLMKFIWCCAVSASRADGVEFGMDFEEFADHLEPDALGAFYGGLGEGEKK